MVFLLQKLSKNLDETLTTNANYENISRAELEDQRQSNCRIQLHNDTLLNQVYLMTKESTEVTFLLFLLF